MTGEGITYYLAYYKQERKDLDRLTPEELKNEVVDNSSLYARFFSLKYNYLRPFFATKSVARCRAAKDILAEIQRDFAKDKRADLGRGFF